MINFVPYIFYGTDLNFFQNPNRIVGDRGKIKVLLYFFKIKMEENSYFLKLGFLLCMKADIPLNVLFQLSQESSS